MRYYLLLSNFSMKKIVFLAYFCINLTATAGCTMQKMDVPETSYTSDMVSTAAKQIHEDLIDLRSILDNKQSIPNMNTSYTGILTKPISLTWIGPAVPAIQAVAKLINFTVEIHGHLSKISPVIKIESVERSALSVLEDIGWQCGPSMGVVVKENEKKIYVFFEK